MKNDITYEYRVFTNRRVDIESMEVGICTSKVIKELKPKDKVDGRFFHTSDTDEWFFCWNGELQKLNFKGDSDVSSALDEVKKLMSEANAAVNEAKAIANEAKTAADDAKAAADSANAAVENIDSKADQSVVDELSQVVESKAEKAVVEELAQAVEVKADQSVVDELSAKVDAIPSMEEVALKSDFNGYATEEFVLTKIAEAELNDKDVDLSNYATKEDIANFITKDDVPSVEGLASTTYVDEKVSSIEIPSIDGLASEQYVNDRISEINIPSVEGLASETYVDEKVAEIKVPSIDNLATKEEMEGVKTWVNEQGFLTAHSLDNYFTKEEINALIGEAVNITNTILA